MMMVERYKAQYIIVQSPDPVAAIEFTIEQRVLLSTYLAGVLSSRQRAHDILQKKTKLCLEHARALHNKLLTSADMPV